MAATFCLRHSSILPAGFTDGSFEVTLFSAGLLHILIKNMSVLQDIRGMTGC